MVKAIGYIQIPGFMEWVWLAILAINTLPKFMLSKALTHQLGAYATELCLVLNTEIKENGIYLSSSHHVSN